MILSFINKIVFYLKKKRKEKVMHSVRISLNKRGFFDFVVFLICFKPHFFFFKVTSWLFYRIPICSH